MKLSKMTITLIVVAVLALAAILYFFVFKKPSEATKDIGSTKTSSLDPEFAALTDPYPAVQKYLLRFLKTPSLQNKFSDLVKQNQEDPELIPYFASADQIKQYGSELGAAFSHTFWMITQLGVLSSAPANSAAASTATSGLRKELVLM